MNRIFGLSLAVAMLCGGCLSMEKRSEEMNEVMRSWEGSTSDELVVMWGPPDRVTSDESGGGYLFTIILSPRFREGLPMLLATRLSIIHRGRTMFRETECFG